MTLSHNDNYNKNMVSGPQPETVKDYRISAKINGNRQTVSEIEENYKRKRIHRFKELRCNKIRINVSVTNGVPKARVFEVRCYK